MGVDDQRVRIGGAQRIAAVLRRRAETEDAPGEQAVEGML